MSESTQYLSGVNVYAGTGVNVYGVNVYGVNVYGVGVKVYGVNEYTVGVNEYTVGVKVYGVNEYVEHAGGLDGYGGYDAGVCLHTIF